MIGSTLVIQICEKCGYKKYGASIYIFYDYKTKLYGLCFGTIDTMSDNDEKCVEKRYPTLLLDLSPYINKRKIYKSLLKIDDQHFINKFIKLYKNEDDVKSLLLFS